MRTLAYAAMFLLATTTGSWAVDLKLGYFAADGHPRDVAADQFKANVEKRTSGQVAVSACSATTLRARRPRCLSKC